MVRYDPYTDSFIDNPTKETTATINLDAFPKNIIQMNVVNVSDDSINKIADAVVQKLKAEQTEPNCSEIPNNCEPQREYKKWETKPKADKPTEITTCVQVPAFMLEDEPQTERSSE